MSEAKAGAVRAKTVENAQPSPFYEDETLDLDMPLIEVQAAYDVIKVRIRDAAVEPMLDYSD